MIQEAEEGAAPAWLSAFRDKVNGTAATPIDSPEREAPIPMDPTLNRAADIARRLRLSQIDLKAEDIGIKLVPDDELQSYVQLAEKERGALEAAGDLGGEDVPLAGAAFTLADKARVLAAMARVKRGVATIDDERTYLGFLADSARESTYGAGLVDALYGITTLGLEVAAGGAVVGAGKKAAKRAMKDAADKLVSEGLEKAAAEATKRSLARAALDAGAALAVTTGLQEAVPSLLTGEGLTGGGAWTVQTVNTLLQREMTDDEAQEIIDAKNALVPVLLEQGGGLMDGLLRQSITMAAEGTGGVLGKLPVVSQIDALTGAIIVKLSGKVKPGGWGKAIMEIAQQQGVGGELAEEVLDSVATAAIMGDKPIAQALEETLGQLPEFAGALMLLRGGGALATRAADASKSRIRPSGEPQPLATEGGGPVQVAPEVAAEGAAAVEGLAPEVQAADVEAFARDTEKATGSRVELRAVEAERSEEVAARNFLRRFNVETTIAEAPEGADLESLPAAFYPGEGRAVLLRGQPGLVGAAVHEGLHTWEAQQTPERQAEFGAALKEIDPVFMGRVEAFVRAQPLYQNASPELLAEEMRTNVGTLLGGLTAYLTTPAGAKDFALVYGKQPGPVRKVLGALYDWIAERIRLLPQRQRALARARLRVARNEGDPALVAQRVLEALREIRPVKGEATTDAGSPQRTGGTSATAPESRAQVVAPTESVAPRPPKTPADRRANREARKARAAERVRTLAAEAEAAKAAGERASVRASRRRKPEVVSDEADVSPEQAAFGLGPDQGMRFAARPPIDVDGTPRPRENSDGRPIHGTDEGVRAFWRWFGDSKVVDDEGRPLVVYHGTRDHVTRFHPSRVVAGFHFGTTAQANARASGAPSTSLIPAYLRIARLLRATDTSMDWAPKIRAARRAGHDGIVYLNRYEGLDPSQHEAAVDAIAIERGMSPNFVRLYDLDDAQFADRIPGARDSYIVFDPSQIKSATGNRGTFDPASDDIRFAPRPPKDALVANFLEDAEILDLSSKALRAVSDEFLAVERWQKAAEALGASTGANPISAIRRFFGKVAVKGEPIKDFAQRIGDHLRRAGIKLADAGLYAEARHTREAREDFLQKHHERKRLAEERKALVKAAKDVPRDAQFERDLRALEKRIADLDFVPIQIPDGHTAEHYFHEVADVTGMKTSEAEAKLAEFEALPGYKRLGRMIDALNRRTLREQLDYQLITPAQFESRRAQFQHYVPLRTAEVDKPERPRGSGFNVRGPETMRRKGRRSLASNPLVMSLAQAMKTAERGEKNAVGHELRDFLQENRGVIDSAERDVALNDEGKPALDSDEFYLKVNGRDVAIKIENPDVARAMKRLGLPQIPKALRLYGTLFGYWKLAATSLSPEFLLTNFARDVETALVNVSSVARDLDLKGLRRDMLKGVPAAGRTAWQAARQHPVTTGLGDFFEEYRQAGGKIGSFGSASFEAIEQSMESRMSTSPLGKARRGLAPIWSAIEDANGAVEQANRFALFVALRQRGVSVNDAALAARKITVDFSQKGEWGTALSLIYAFFSAAVGGTRRLAETMNSPVGRRIAGGLVGLGFAQTLANYYSSDDDEDGRKFYEKISEGEKERSAIIMVPGFDEPLKIPLGYGLNVFHGAGRIAAETVLGMHSEGEAAHLMLITALNGFAPIGAAPTLAQFVSPTALDPAVQIIENKNFMGNPITPYESKFGAPAPRFAKSFRTTSPLAVDMARALNSLSGGDSIKPGALNLSGDEIEHVYEFVGAGVARFIKRAFDASRAIASGESFSEVAQVAPFLRVVYGSRTEFSDSDLFYEALDTLEYEKRYIKEAEDAGDRERARELRERFRPTLRLERSAKRVKDQAKALRDEAYTNGKLTSPEKLREANLLMQGWTRQYLEALSAK